MKCPHCSRKLELPAVAENHMDCYGQPVNAKTACCGKIVRLEPFLSYRVDKANSDLTEDDWGNEVSK